MRHDPSTGEKLFSVSKIAEALGISVETVRALIADGQFPGAFRATRRGDWQIPESAYNAFREAGGAS